MNNTHFCSGLAPKRLVLLSIGLSAGAVLVGIFSKPSVAQQNPQLFDGYQPNEYDLSGRDSLGSSLDPMNLYHQINLNRGRNPEEFRQDSQQDIKDAASEFKRQQQQMEQTTTDDL